MQNIINAKCLKAVENIPVTAQLECSLTTRSIMLLLPERAARLSPAAAGSSSLTSVARFSRPESQQLTSGRKRKCVTAVGPFPDFYYHRESSSRHCSPQCSPVGRVFKVLAPTPGCQLMMVISAVSCCSVTGTWCRLFCQRSSRCAVQPVEGMT